MFLFSQTTPLLEDAFGKLDDDAWNEIQFQGLSRERRKKLADYGALPDNPITGKPFHYVPHADHAILTSEGTDSQETRDMLLAWEVRWKRD